jgi:hypothetical protein
MGENQKQPELLKFTYQVPVSPTEKNINFQYYFAKEYIEKGKALLNSKTAKENLIMKYANPNIDTSPAWLGFISFFTYRWLRVSKGWTRPWAVSITFFVSIPFVFIMSGLNGMSFYFEDEFIKKDLLAGKSDIEIKDYLDYKKRI